MMVLSNIPWGSPLAIFQSEKEKEIRKQIFTLAAGFQPDRHHHRFANFKTTRTVTAFLIESSNSTLLPFTYGFPILVVFHSFLSRRSLSKRLIILLITFFSGSRESLFFPSEIRKRRQPIKASNSPRFFVATSSRVLSTQSTLRINIYTVNLKFLLTTEYVSKKNNCLKKRKIYITIDIKKLFKLKHLTNYIFYCLI